MQNVPQRMKAMAVNLAEYTKTLRGYLLSWVDKQMDRNEFKGAMR